MSGCAIAVSLISSAPAVVPNLIRSQPASSDQAASRSATPGSSSHGPRKPGVWAPWPGAAMTSIFLPCTVGVRHTNRKLYELFRRLFIAILQKAPRELGRLMDQPAIDDGQPH